MSPSGAITFDVFLDYIYDTGLRDTVNKYYIVTKLFIGSYIFLVKYNDLSSIAV